MTEKGTPPLPRPSGGEGENVAGAKHVPDVSRRKSGSYKTVHWQALEFCAIAAAQPERFARTHVRGYGVVVADVRRRDAARPASQSFHTGS